MNSLNSSDLHGSANSANSANSRNSANSAYSGGSPESPGSPGSSHPAAAAAASAFPSPSGPHPLLRYGWDSRVADAFAPYEDEGLLPARIVRVDRGRCDAVTSEGVVRAGTGPVATSDPTRVICTGDWAALSPGTASVASGPGAAADGRPQVRALLPRRTAFVRSTATNRSEGQVLAANVDTALIAVSLAEELELARVERFVALAWTSGASPLIVLTKADLVGDRETLAQLTADVEASAPGVQVLDPPRLIDDYDVSAILLVRYDPAFYARQRRMEALGFRVALQAGAYVLLMRD